MLSREVMFRWWMNSIIACASFSNEGCLILGPCSILRRKQQDTLLGLMLPLWLLQKHQFPLRMVQFHQWLLDRFFLFFLRLSNAVTASADNGNILQLLIGLVLSEKNPLSGKKIALFASVDRLYIDWNGEFSEVSNGGFHRFQKYDEE